MFSLLGGLVPNLVGGLANGLTGAAAKVLEDVGIKLPSNSKNPEKELEKIVAKADPETLAKIKEADHRFKIEMQKMKVDFSAMGYADTQNAREIQTRSKSMLVPFLAIFIVMAAFLSVFFLFFMEIPVQNRDLVNVFFGIIVGYSGNVVTFYFGASDVN